MGEFKLEIDLKEVTAIETKKEDEITIISNSKQYKFKDLLFAKETSKLILSLAQKNQKIILKKNNFDDVNFEFFSITQNELDTVLKEFPLRKYSKGDKIIDQGKYIKEIFYLVKGKEKKILYFFILFFIFYFLFFIFLDFIFFFFRFYINLIFLN